MQTWVTTTCWQSTRFQVNPWLFFLLLIYQGRACLFIRKTLITTQPGGGCRGAGLNFGWILKSPWELKNDPVPEPHTRIITLDPWGGSQVSFFELPRWFRAQPTLRSIDIGGMKCTWKNSFTLHLLLIMSKNTALQVRVLPSIPTTTWENFLWLYLPTTPTRWARTVAKEFWACLRSGKELSGLDGWKWFFLQTQRNPKFKQSPNPGLFDSRQCTVFL